MSVLLRSLRTIPLVCVCLSLAGASACSLDEEPSPDTHRTVRSALAPSATSYTGGTAISATEDTGETITLEGVDVDGDQVTFEIVTDPTNGTLSITSSEGPQTGTFDTTDTTTLDVTYTANSETATSDSFTYEIDDGNGGTDTGTVDINITLVDETPSITTTPPGAAEQTAYSYDADATDPEGGSLTWSVLGADDCGGSIDSNGVYTFSEPPGGDDPATTCTLSIQVCDTSGPNCQAQTEPISITPDNDAPTITSSAPPATATEDTQYSHTFTATDPESTTLKWFKVNANDDCEGSAIDEDTGVYTFTETGDIPPTECTLSVEVCDEGGTGVCTGTGDVPISITSNNDAPSITSSAPPTTVTEDTQYSHDFDASDPEGTTLVFSLTSNNCENESLNTSTGEFTFLDDGPTPTSCSYTIEVCDENGSGECASETIGVTITPVNDPPTIDNTAPNTAQEDTLYSHTFTATDPESTGLVWSVLNATDTCGGSFTGSTYEFTPTGPTPGTSCTVHVQLCDSGSPLPAECVDQQVNVTIDLDNDPVVITSNAPTQATEDSEYSYSASANDPESSTLTWTVTSDDTCEGSSIDSTGHYTFEETGPIPPVSGTCKLEIEVCDTPPAGTTATCDIETVTVNIEQNNDPPTIDTSAPLAATEDTQYNYDADATDPEGTTLTWNVITADDTCPNSQISSAGVYSFTPDGPSPADDCVLAIEVCDDGSPEQCDSEQVTIDIDPVNDAPSITNSPAGPATEDNQFTYTATADDPEGTSFTWDVPAGDTCGGSITSAGVYTFTPTGPNPADDCIIAIEACDTDPDDPSLCDTASTPIDITPVNDAPTANADSVATNEDTALTITLTGSDPDNGDTLSFAIDSSPSDGSLGSINQGTGQVVYTPDADFNGSDSFDFEVDDGNGGTDTATIDITVNPVNDAPVADDDSDATNEDIAVTIDVLANDNDIDSGSLTVTAVSNPPNGAAVVSNLGSDVTYTPDNDFNGQDTFTYTVEDPDGASDTATVTVTVNPVNDAPVANTDDVTTDEDTPITIDVLANDDDVEGDSLSVFAPVGVASNGVATTAGGTVTYAPNANFNGTDSFTYTASDGNGGFDQGTVNVTITPVNDPPVANPDFENTPEDTAVTVDVLANDFDVEGDQINISAITSQPANGTATSNGDEIVYTPDANFVGTDTLTYAVTDGLSTSSTNVTITVGGTNDDPVANDDSATTDEGTAATIDVLANDTDADGDTLAINSVGPASNGSTSQNGTEVTYTPNANFSGTDSFTYEIQDGNGGTDSATVTVTVTSVNEAPVANDDSASTPEETAVTVDVLINDNDPDGDALTITSTTQPSNGTVTNTASDVSYTPDSNFSGSDTFTYTIEDPSGESDTATVTVDVSSRNDPPTFVSPTPAANTLFMVTEGDLFEFTVAADDPDGDTLTYDVTPLPAGASIDGASGAFAWAPTWEDAGTTLLTMSATDGTASIDRDVEVEVDFVDDDSDGLPDSFESDNGLDPTTNDSDGDTISDETEVGDVYNPSDTDDDGTIDALDDDSDDDGISDADEAGDDDVDTDPVDTDSDDTPDFQDTDSDDDGVEDATDNCPVDANSNQADADNDGIGDVCEDEDDADGDGIPDAVEEDNGLDPDDPDSDGDTIADGDEAGDDLANLADTDDDGIIDALDDDSDGDGILDADEAGDDDLATAPNDTDGDGTPDFQDLDSDDDGVEDSTDNCLLVNNPDQMDTDGDGTGDACTDDIDGDGIPDDEDNCPTVADIDQLDTDMDGAGNVCDDDDDGDGVADDDDECRLEPADTPNGCPATNNGTNNASNNGTNNASNNASNNATNNMTGGSTTDGGGTKVTGDDGCGCSSANNPSNALAVLFVMLGLFGLRRRRRV